VYFVAGELGLRLAFLHPSVTPIWAPAGVALAALLVLGYRVWPGILLGSFILNLTTNGSIATSIGIACGNTVEGLLGATLVSLFANGRSFFLRAQDILKFVLFAGVLSTAFAATTGATSLALGGFARWDQFGAIWFTWWLGDMVGSVVIAPLLLTWIVTSLPGIKPRQAIEGIYILSAIILFGLVLFLEGTAFPSMRYLYYLSFLPLGWAAFRFEQPGATTSAFLLSCIALWGTLHGLGPFVTPDPNVSLLLLQVFVGSISIMGLVLASLVSEHRRSEQRLRFKVAISLVLAESSTLKEAAPGIIRVLCEMCGWDVGSFWQADQKENRLVCLETWHVPGADLHGFENQTREMTFSPGIGLPGRVWLTGRPEWIPDIRKENGLPRGELCQKAGLRAAMAFPVRFEDEVLGVIECFSRTVRESDGSFIGILPATGSSIGQFMERKRAEEELRKTRNELEIRVRERTADLVRANEELRKRDLQLSTAQQIAHLGSWEWDVRTSQVTWSDELYSIFGLRPGEFPGTLGAFLEMVHPEDRAEVVEQIQAAAHTRSSFEFQERIIRSDGSIRVLQSRGRVTVDPGSEAVKFNGVCLDVTDRNRAEEKFRGLLESAPDAMVIADKDGRIVLVNAQTERLFGYGRTELLEQRVEMLFPEWCRPLHQMNRERYTTAPRSNPGESLELYGLKKDGTEFPVEISLSPLETEEGVLVSSAIRDITDQKLLRTRLLEAERSRSMDLRRYAHSIQQVQEEERQRIARELHDDLCQRLSGMKLNLEVVADRFRTKHRTLYRRLRDLDKQFEEMISEVRRMSANLRPAVLDDFGLVTALGLLTRAFGKLHRIPVELEIDESDRLQLDEQVEIALYRITQEALSNVVRHAHASRITLRLDMNDESVTLSIADDGKGITPAERRGNKSHHRGLGLISMRERTELLGGVFRVESPAGTGTTVSVSIPLRTSLV
jgi:PAS domain S-box-containing protein